MIASLRRRHRRLIVPLGLATLAVLALALWFRAAAPPPSDDPRLAAPAPGPRPADPGPEAP